MTYAEYLQTDHWKTLRFDAKRRAGFKCEHCDTDLIELGFELHAHHLVYRNPLESCTVDDIMALCEFCHRHWHEWLKIMNFKVSDFDRKRTLLQLRVMMNHFEPYGVCVMAIFKDRPNIQKLFDECPIVP